MAISEINVISLLLIIIFFLPIAAGAFGELSRERVRHSFCSLFDNIEFIGSTLLAIYFTKRIFFEHDGSFFSTIYNFIPGKIKEMLFAKDMITYIIAVPFILILILLVIRVITTPLYRYVVVPASEGLYSGISSMGKGFRRIVGALWQIPKAVTTTLIFALILNFSMYYIYSPVLSKWMNESSEYQFIYKNVMYPVLNSNIAKKIPVLVNDTFRDADGKNISQKLNPAGDAIEKLTGGNIKVIEYFNGVTLDEAVKSNKQIDDTAKKVVGSEKNDKKKAYLIYNWVRKNIKYDYSKAEKIVSDPKSCTSGSITAFETRKGICFDFSSLYVSMCRAVNLKVRLVTGIGYSGVAWGDHAWNQVYYPAEKRWINVDSTFGSTGVNYFDKQDFNVDHRNADVQGEW